MNTLSKLTVLSLILGFSMVVFASEYSTDRDLKIGDSYAIRDVNCIVKAQLDLGPGSDPLLTTLGKYICRETYEKTLKVVTADQFVLSLMNGSSRIVNCLICDKNGK